MKRLVTAITLLAMLPLAEIPGQHAPRPYAEARDYTKWEKEVAAYEAADRQNPPPKDGILFIGSSTIRLWKTLSDEFPDHKVINRGFGGTEIVDSTHFADRLIFPHVPKQIFLRAGGNDIHAGRTPREVAADFLKFVRTVQERLPKTEILFIALSPAPAMGRGGQDPRIEQADPGDGPGIAARRIRGCLRHQPHLRREGPPRIVRQGQAPFRPRGLQAARRTRPSVPGAIESVNRSIRTATTSRDAWEIREIRCRFVFSGKNDELTPDFLSPLHRRARHSHRRPHAIQLLGRLFPHRPSVASGPDVPAQCDRVAPILGTRPGWDRHARRHGSGGSTR